MDIGYLCFLYRNICIWLSECERVRERKKEKER